MSAYGRNFDFRVPPVHGQRGGRYVLPKVDGAKPVAIGAPVKWTGDPTDVNGLMPVELATGASAPVKGQCGILVYELDPGIGLAGADPVLTTYSDYDLAPVGRSVQVVSGDMVKAVFKNTEDRTFLTAREYKGRLMVAGDPAVGDFLAPGAGNDEDGYWAVTNNPDEAWMIVEGVDSARHEVEARLAF